MSTDAPTPPPPPPPPGEPPTPGEPPPPPPENDGGDASAQLVALNRKYDSERKARARAEKALSDIQAAGQTEAERATEQARNEGRAEGVKSAGAKLVAAEFRAAASGKLADPAAALEYLDLARFVGDDGEPDTDAIAAAVERLATAVPAANGKPKAPTVPNGVMPPAEDADWLRAAIKTP